MIIAVINDISFQYPFASREQAKEAVHRFIDICKRIKKDEMTNVHEIKRVNHFFRGIDVTTV